MICWCHVIITSDFFWTEKDSHLANQVTWTWAFISLKKQSQSSKFCMKPFPLQISSHVFSLSFPELIIKKFEVSSSSMINKKYTDNILLISVWWVRCQETIRKKMNKALWAGKKRWQDIFRYTKSTRQPNHKPFFFTKYALKIYLYLINTH